MAAIYLVDDHPLMREGLRAVLEHHGHRVVGEAGEPTAALAELQRLQPEVLLLDLQLGDRSGFEILEQLRARRLAVRTIVLTMYAQPGQVAQALRLGAAGYVLKGSHAADVLAAIEAVVQGRRHLGPRVDELAAAALLEEPKPSPLERLSLRERQTVAMVVRGLSSAAIAEQLHLSPKTVESYRSRLMTKLGVSDLPALVRLAIREGLISADEV